MKAKNIKLVVVLLATAVVLAALAAPASASVVPATQIKTSYGQNFTVNYDNITVWLDGTPSSVILGQDVQFYNATGDPSGVVTLVGISDNNAGETRFSDSTGWLDTTGMKTGDYNATGTSAGCLPTVIHLGTTEIILELKKGTTSVSSAPQGTHFTIKLTTSLDPNDGVSLKVKDPNGDTLKKNPADGTVFSGVNVSHVRDLDINTSGWALGTYTFQVSTSATKARGLSMKSEEKTLKIIKSAIEIKAAKTTVAERDTVKLTVTGVPKHKITVSVVTGGQYAIFPGGVNNNPATETVGTFNHSIGNGGKRTYTVYFNKTGSYKVKVEDMDSGEEDTVHISVVKKKVTFHMPDTCVIGNDLVINGTSTAGDTVDIAIDDVIVKTDIPIDENGIFKKELPTPDTRGTGVEDDIEIEAFINTNYVVGQRIADFNDDGSTTVSMVSGGLTVQSSSEAAALGDSFILSGTAPGSDAVDIIVVAPRGGGGKGVDPSNSALNGLPSGITYETASTSGKSDAFSIEVNVQKNADTGTYLVFVLSPGKDGVYGRLDTGDLLEGLKTTYAGRDLKNLAGKTQEQLEAIITDATIGTAGSDDFMKVLRIKIGERMVKLDPVADVEIGSDLVITGISNREGRSINVKVTGPTDLGKKTVSVTKGVFTATFNTSKALTGEYKIEVDDRDGHTDTTSVNITAEIKAIATPTPTATATATPEASASIPAPAPATTPSSSPTSNPKIPGFEAVFAIAGLIVAGIYLLIRKRRGGEK
ncbi:hypothetical protein KAW18_12630 [candidate division WOR-3 bacterium]|nr:hypothetical protein [candidate division WOR-3 bacterium]